MSLRFPRPRHRQLKRSELNKNVGAFGFPVRGRGPGFDRAEWTRDGSQKLYQRRAQMRRVSPSGVLLRKPKA